MRGNHSPLQCNSFFFNPQRIIFMAIQVCAHPGSPPPSALSRVSIIFHFWKVICITQSTTQFSFISTPNLTIVVNGVYGSFSEGSFFTHKLSRCSVEFIPARRILPRVKKRVINTSSSKFYYFGHFTRSWAHSFHPEKRARCLLHDSVVFPVLCCILWWAAI